MTSKAVIIGAGPAGLTAARELLLRSEITPVVLEQRSLVGGLACTVRHHGNRIDIGGHRFFSKSDRVMDWWLEILPLESTVEPIAEITYHRRTRTVAPRAATLVGGEGAACPEADDRVMLLRRRRSRIYYLRRFFDYPIRLSLDTLRGLGLLRSVRIALSYLRSVLWPIHKPRNLEEFFVNRFGRELYRTFFKSYTEKVWGTSCTEISAEWGAQRVKGLSITSAVLHFLKGLLGRGGASDLAQKSSETSLIERFLYPKLGPGQMWEEVAREVEARGGALHLGQTVTGLDVRGSRIVAVEARDQGSGEVRRHEADYVFSSMPIVELVRALRCAVPEGVREIAEGLVYRDFITVGLLLRELEIAEPGGGRVEDNWIYIQEPEVALGRLQIFNNWSPWLVADPSTTWLGLEYFCNEGDELWRKSDQELAALGGWELEQIGIARQEKVLDSVVIRMPKTYPAYFGTYPRFGELRAYLDGFENLFLVGRNGMHKYNNQDHSMLTAMLAVDNILAGRTDKSNLWEVNTEDDYHEEK